MSDMSSSEPAGDDVFSAADLRPGAATARKFLADRLATTVAVVALGTWAGGLVALGACAAPFVFNLTPYPFSGNAMGAAFQRFDSIAIGCGVVALGCEVVRTLVDWRGRPRISSRIRRYLAIVIALGAVYTGVRLTPTILGMHQDGVRRHVGANGAELERIHKQAETIGKTTVPIAIALIGLHIFTLRSPLELEWDDEEEAQAPLLGKRPRNGAPGPSVKGTGDG